LEGKELDLSALSEFRWINRKKNARVAKCAAPIFKTYYDKGGIS
jgi:hypothetical protein